MSRYFRRLAVLAVAQAAISFSVVAQEKDPAPAQITFLTGGASNQAKPGAANHIWSVFVDGQLIVTLRRDRFLTLTVISGEHDLRSEHSAVFNLRLEPGEHAYVLLGTETMRKLTCADVIAYTSESRPKPADLRDVHTGVVEVDRAFHSDCEGRAVLSSVK